MNATIAIKKVGIAQVTDFDLADGGGVNGHCKLPTGEVCFFFTAGETKTGITCKVWIPGADDFVIGKITRHAYAEMLGLV